CLAVLIGHVSNPELHVTQGKSGNGTLKRGAHHRQVTQSCSCPGPARPSGRPSRSTRPPQQILQQQQRSPCGRTTSATAAPTSSLTSSAASVSPLSRSTEATEPFFLHEPHMTVSDRVRKLFESAAGTTTVPTTHLHVGASGRHLSPRRHAERGFDPSCFASWLGLQSCERERCLAAGCGFQQPGAVATPTTCRREQSRRHSVAARTRTTTFRPRATPWRNTEVCDRE
ncbi:unnamed protein product, partial [Ixodes persulcatus]